MLGTEPTSIFGKIYSPEVLEVYCAALQHEISVQKIALVSLQGEHDKLLAAFSRSQTRASVLEKQHAVSDVEIINLTEQKITLQTQVMQLERDVEELSRARDEYRQAAVQEGAQYVEIVKKASQLEEIAGEERKSWNKIKGDLERKGEQLRVASNETKAIKKTTRVEMRSTENTSLSTGKDQDEAEESEMFDKNADTRRPLSYRRAGRCRFADSSLGVFTHINTDAKVQPGELRIKRNSKRRVRKSLSRKKMKKRVLRIFDGPSRLSKDEMMLDTDYEDRVELNDNKSYAPDLDTQSMRQADTFHAARDEEQVPPVAEETGINSSAICEMCGNDNRYCDRYYCVDC